MLRVFGVFQMPLIFLIFNKKTKEIKLLRIIL